MNRLWSWVSRVKCTLRGKTMQHLIFHSHKAINPSKQNSYHAALWPLIEFFLLINSFICSLPYQTSKQQHAERRVPGNALTAWTELDQVLPLQRFPHHPRLWSSCYLDSLYPTHPPQQDTGSDLSHYCHTCIFFHHITDCFFFPPLMLQLLAFNQIQFPGGESMVQTFRPVQSLNGRQVFYSAGHVPLASLALLMVSVLVSRTL